jgi:hypothetical protein
MQAEQAATDCVNYGLESPALIPISRRSTNWAQAQETTSARRAEEQDGVLTGPSNNKKARTNRNELLRSFHTPK